jgi:hypothetical protein
MKFMYLDACILCISARLEVSDYTEYFGGGMRNQTLLLEII